jgi:hypothetical protein
LTHESIYADGAGNSQLTAADELGKLIACPKPKSRHRQNGTTASRRPSKVMLSTTLFFGEMVFPMDGDMVTLPK